MDSANRRRFDELFPGRVVQARPVPGSLAPKACGCGEDYKRSVLWSAVENEAPVARLACSSFHIIDNAIEFPSNYRE